MTRCVFLITFITLAAGGCASQSCRQSLAYQKATIAPALRAPPGLQVPRPDPRYQIPPAQGDHPSYLYKVPDPEHPKQKVTRCLVMPPPLPSNEGGGVPSNPPKPQV